MTFIVFTNIYSPLKWHSVVKYKGTRKWLGCDNSGTEHIPTRMCIQWDTAIQ